MFKRFFGERANATEAQIGKPVDWNDLYEFPINNTDIYTRIPIIQNGPLPRFITSSELLHSYNETLELIDRGVASEDDIQRFLKELDEMISFVAVEKKLQDVAISPSTYVQEPIGELFANLGLLEEQLGGNYRSIVAPLREIYRLIAGGKEADALAYAKQLFASLSNPNIGGALSIAEVAATEGNLSLVSEENE